MKKNVIDLLAIGIGHDVSKYYSRAITIDDANKLAEVMLQKLTGIFFKKLNTIWKLIVFSNLEFAWCDLCFLNLICSYLFHHCAPQI